MKGGADTRKPLPPPPMKNAFYMVLICPRDKRQGWWCKSELWYKSLLYPFFLSLSLLLSHTHTHTQRKLWPLLHLFCFVLDIFSFVYRNQLISETFVWEQNPISGYRRISAGRALGCWYYWHNFSLLCDRKKTTFWMGVYSPADIRSGFGGC